VQEDLETALQEVTGRSTSLVFSGRTDRGVHAVGQVASGRVVWQKDLERLRHALDALTGDDLVVKSISEVDERFHARFSARRREYRYRIWIAERSPILMRDSVWWVREGLDLERLNRAGARLIGEHDFRSFTGKGFGSGASTRETRRLVDRSEWRELTNEFEPGGRLVEFRIRADAFLPHMVRNIVGTMIDIGAGRRDLDWLEALIEERDRRNAPPPAPPHGLVLWKVEYEQDDNRGGRG
jgi:tRNA pseudouridine38-40 synthase